MLSVVERRLANRLAGRVPHRSAVSVTGVGVWKADRLETCDGHAVEPLPLGDLDVDEVVLFGLVEILDPVWVPAQLVEHLQSRHPQVAVEVERAEAPGKVPAPAALPRIGRVERVAQDALGKPIVGSTPAEGTPVGQGLRRLRPSRSSRGRAPAALGAGQK